MRRLMTRAAVVVAAGAVAGTLGAAGVSAAGAAARAPQPARTSSLAAARGLAVPGARLWVQRYSDPGNGSDVASSVAVSPGGGTVFVTGTSAASDYLTVAYNAATGARLWTARYNGSTNFDNHARAVAVSPDGATVFVTGDSSGGQGFLQDYATVAYRASDGTQLWVARFNGPASYYDDATAVSVARDGTAVFVTGISWENDNAGSMATVAYRASDGAQLWVKSWGALGAFYGGAAIVSPGGNRVFVTGHVQSKAFTGQYGTVAYNAATGARLWAQRYAGFGATSIAVSPDLARVYVTGSTRDANISTLAYSARTGTRLWVRKYLRHRSDDRAYSVAVSPGGTVLVTGSSRRFAAGSNADYAAVAYSPGGARLWARRYGGPGADIASAVAAPGNGKVYVTGTSWGGSVTRDDYATVAYNVRTGAQLWVRRYNGPARPRAQGGDSATALAARGGRVFVTGGSTGTTSGDDFATIAYNG